MSSWLPDSSLASLRDALREVDPGLSRGRIVLHDRIAQSDPRWWCGSATIDERFVVKFAWSEPASTRLRHEVRVLGVLGTDAELPHAPTIVAASVEPALLVTELIGGVPLTDDLVRGADPASVATIGEELASFLAHLHRSSVLELVEASLGTLESPEPQASTTEIRESIERWVMPDQLPTILRWCDWVDEIQATTRRRVLVHGDLHGHNQVWSTTDPSLRLVVDFEQSGPTEPEFDLRYLASQGPDAHLLCATVAAYEQLTGTPLDLAHVMAWHVRTMLGDVLWRSRAGVPLPDGGTPDQWVVRIDKRLGLVDAAPRLGR